jgi:beta-phosphoglucomutase-like phosphatase (HAD superfamily)
MKQEANVALSDMAVRGELAVSTTITEEEIEEMEVDKQLHLEAIAKLKQRLSIRIRDQEALEARLRAAHKLIADRKKKQKQDRMQLLRTQRAALMRQQSEQAARADPPKDLTTEGIEPVRQQHNSNGMASASGSHVVVSGFLVPVF